MEDYDYMLAAMNSLGNSLTNNANVIMAANTSRQDRNFSREMSDLAWQRNLEAWRMQNEYNLPTNQYRRQLEGLQANGLNPNLVYGNASSVSSAAGMPSAYKFEGYHSTAVPRFGSQSPVQDMLSTRLLQTQVAAQEAQNRFVNARADNEEARHPGVVAKSEEASKRWETIFNNIGQYEESVKASLAKEYWTGVKAQLDAEYSEDRSRMSNVEAAMAEWLSETFVPGMDMTYRQYMEACKAFLPGAQYDKMKAEIHDIASRMAYRAQQGQFLELRKEYQTYLNRLAKYGRSLGNDWVTLLLSGISQIFGKDPAEILKGVVSGVGGTQLDMPSNYPGP